MVDSKNLLFYRKEPIRRKTKSHKKNAITDPEWKCGEMSDYRPRKGGKGLCLKI
jgi:hypothetical protein